MLQTILSVAVVQLDIYSDKLLSFPHRPIAHIFALKKQDMSDFSFIPPTSVVTIHGANASAAFTSKTSEVFKEEHDIATVIINDKMKYIPWGSDNQMPYNIIDLIEFGETMSTCQIEGITNREYPIPSIIDIVNSIRLAKGNVFAEWKQSDTVRLFEKPWI